MNNTRREFITTSGAALGALTLTEKLKAQDFSTEYRVGLIGCGGRGSGAVAQNLSVSGPTIKLVAMADVFESNLKGSLNQLKNHFGEKIDVPDDRQFVGFDAYEKVLALPDVNVVVLATPPGFRPFHFEAAVKAGKHVFMEKPVCVDAHGANIVAAAAKEADAKRLNVTVGLQRRYQRNYRAAYEQFQNGVLGDVIRAEVYWNGGRPWVRDRRPGDTEMMYQLRNWYHFNWLCGDNIVEQHVHNIDVANWFLGDKPPIKARGIGGRQTLTDKRYGEIFDHHVVEFHYENGVIVHSTCEHFPNSWDTVSETIIGTKGVLRLSGNDAIIRDHSGKVIWRYRPDNDPDPYQVEHDEFYANLAADKRRNDAYYALNSSFCAVLGRYCTYSGKEITWKEAFESQQRLTPEKFGPNEQPPVLPDADGNYPIAKPGQYDWRTARNIS